MPQNRRIRKQRPTPLWKLQHWNQRYYIWRQSRRILWWNSHTTLDTQWNTYKSYHRSTELTKAKRFQLQEAKNYKSLELKQQSVTTAATGTLFHHNDSRSHHHNRKEMYRTTTTHTTGIRSSPITSLWPSLYSKGGGVTSPS